MADYWDPTDRQYEWSIEKEIEEMMYRGRMRMYDRLYEGSVESVKLHSDGSADVDIYGKDDTDEKGHWHFRVRYDRDGHITDVINCHRN